MIEALFLAIFILHDKSELWYGRARTLTQQKISLVRSSKERFLEESGLQS